MSIWAQTMRLDHPSGVLRMSTLYVPWTDPEGAEWIGGGLVLAVSPRGPVATVDGGSLAITWSGASAALIQEALHPGVLRADFEIATVLIDDADMTRIGDPFDIWRGYAETPRLEFDPANPTITLTIQSPLLDLGRARREVLSAESQRRINPLDTGADWVAQLRDYSPQIEPPPARGG